MQSPIGAYWCKRLSHGGSLAWWHSPAGRSPTPINPLQPSSPGTHLGMKNGDWGMLCMFSTGVLAPPPSWCSACSAWTGAAEPTGVGIGKGLDGSRRRHIRNAISEAVRTQPTEHGKLIPAVGRASIDTVRPWRFACAYIPAPLFLCHGLQANACLEWIQCCADCLSDVLADPSPPRAP